MAESRIRRIRIQAGVCAYCGGEIDTDGLYCTKCRESYRVRNQERTHFRREHNLCVQCGKPVQNTYYCRECTDYRANRHNERMSGKGAATVSRAYNPGMIRKLDDLGRICLPIEVRRIMGIAEKHEPVEMFVEGDALIFKKYEPTCVFCAGTNVDINYKGKNICNSCITELKILSHLR